MKENFITLCFLCNPHLSLSFIISLKLYALWDQDPDHSSSHWTEDNWTIMILPLLISLIAPNLLQARHFLVETEDNKDEDNKDEDNKENLDAEDRLKDLLTEKQVNKVINAFPNPQNAEVIYKSMNKSAQHAIKKKLHQAYGGDENAVRLPLV